ncbi:hypothetical protein [Mumia zhuanghuii]|uniref:hypothetical protein n=1 Tax=Mumia zhuanghuii TaxID=2585211 RepID=UPI001E49C131|nr:hypothetical protein [Mumia zhuanghuii]
MGNPAGTKASREEEMAFLAIEQVLSIEITMLDAGGSNKVPDGSWTSAGGAGRLGIVEVASSPAIALMKDCAAAKREGKPQFEDASVPARLGELAEVRTELLAEDWA